MLRAYKYRLSPTPEQAAQLNGAFGCCRLVYNLALEAKQTAWQKGFSLTEQELSKQLPDFKHGFEWASDCPSQSLQHTIKHLDTAFKNMFAGRAKYPRFKSRHDRQSLHVPAGIKADFAGGRVFVPKFK